ncbi:MAG: Nif3-like dinuclear metal center hexameric protein [Gammaproteobacteria bacterium]|nr:MAG: Nif3-like dinuclear metal center hexameric protein [Gammaproteobacteria bacterium]
MGDIQTTQIVNFCNDYLNIDNIDDYCPNGLQIQGSPNTTKIITAVSVSANIILQAIEEKAQTILTHHGFFWKNEAPQITGIKRTRIKLLLENNINLLTYHLPLDIHPLIGNNIRLAKTLNLVNIRHKNKGGFYYGEFEKEISMPEFNKFIDDTFKTHSIYVGDSDKKIKTVGLCTGAGQNFMQQAIDLNLDIFISGEHSENNYYLANESETNFISMGHHNSEKYGIMKLGELLQDKFFIQHKFLDSVNPF